MKNLKSFTTVLCMAFASGTLSGQALKISNDDLITINSQTIINSLLARDGLDITTSGSNVVYPSGADLIWGSFYQVQPNNPGLFSLTSVSSPMGWNPCFTVRANGKVGIMNNNPSVALEIGSSSSLQQVKVNGSIVWGSDVRMKENIQDIPGSLAQLRKLRGVSYQLKQEAAMESIPEKVLATGLGHSTEKAMLQETATAENPLASRTIYGFLAQDVRELYPDLVYEDDDNGMLSVDYIGLIPILVNALKEQQTQMEDLQAQITTLRERNGSEKSIDSFHGSTESLAVLRQNTPNPFNVSTEIGFYIPQEVQVANLYVYDIKGLQKKSISITDREEGSITLDAATLNAGIYFYTLICDGKPVDSKQMVLTR